jgi:tetratricopeptide (TPR) repeat protein
MLLGFDRLGLHVAFIAVAFAAVATSAYAQVRRIPGSAQIEGKVTDEQGRPVADATVEVRGLTAKTNENGDYRFPKVPGGIYIVIVSKPGVGTARAQGSVRVPFSAIVNVTLRRLTAEAEGRCAGAPDTQTLDEKGAAAFSALSRNSQPRSTIPALMRLLQWLVAAEHHIAGCADVPATTIAGWSWRELDTLLGDLAELSTFLQKVRESGQDLRARERPPTTITLHERILTRSDVERIFHGNATLKRGAVLHADIGVSIGDDLNRHPMLVADGRQQGNVRGTVHFQVGRELLASVVPSPGVDADALLWYRAISAYLLRSSRLNEAPAHLERARQVFSTHPVFLVDSAYLHEKLASPAVQAAAEEMRDKGMNVGVESRRIELERAERFFRQALTLAPGAADARLRLGRTLGELGRHEEAAAELRRVRDGEGGRQRRYLVELFLGREEQQLGRADEARRHFENAAALYPDAQSPRLALSLLARKAGDRKNALLAIQPIPPAIAENDVSDPFWSYDEYHLIDADALLEQMRMIGAGK